MSVLSRVAILASVGVLGVAQAETYQVGGPGADFQTIGAALAVAGRGDVVIVFQGTYRESVTVPSGVTLQGFAPLDPSSRDATVVSGDFDNDGQADAGTVITVSSGARSFGITVEFGGTGLNAVENTILENIRARHCGTGISTAAILMSSVASDCAFVGINGSDDAVITGCTSSGNQGSGFGGNAEVSGCTARNNGGTGIAGSTIASSVSEDNGSAGYVVNESASGLSSVRNGVGFVASGEAILTDCDSIDAAGDGFSVTVGNVPIRLVRCTAQGSGDFGFDIRAKSELTQCIASQSGQSGFFLDGAVTVDACEAADNAESGFLGGFSVEAVLRDCVATGNSVYGYSRLNRLERCQAMENDLAGIESCAEVVDCDATSNGAGMLFCDVVEMSRAIENVDSGIWADEIIDCSAIDNFGLGMFAIRISGGVSRGNLLGGADVSEFAEGLVLESNFTPGFGGGMYVRRGAVVRDCTFTDNFAIEGGGAYVQAPTSGSRAEVAGCVFERNFAFEQGGGASGEATFNGCEFYANMATLGGGLFGDGLMVNCAVAGNGAYLDGGGAFFDGDVSNCTIVANRSGRSGGGLRSNSSGVGTVGNCVLWMNQTGLSGANLSGSYLQIAFSVVEGGLGDIDGVAGVDYIDDQNLDIDPGFVATPDDGGDGFGDVVTTPDVDEGANDFLGDLRLASGSPAIDAGNNFVLPLDDNDADGDGRTIEPIPFDLDGHERIVDDPMTVDTGFVGDGEGVAVVDIGAYEFQPSPGGSPCPADLSPPEGILDFDDVLAFLVAFGAMEAPADLAEPFGEIDFDDVLAFLVSFGSGCP